MTFCRFAREIIMILESLQDDFPKNWGCPADHDFKLLTNQTVLDPKVHCYTSRAPQVGIEPTSPPTQVVALPTKPQIPIMMQHYFKFKLPVFDYYRISTCTCTQSSPTDGMHKRSPCGLWR